MIEVVNFCILLIIIYFIATVALEVVGSILGLFAGVCFGVLSLLYVVIRQAWPLVLTLSILGGIVWCVTATRAAKHSKIRAVEISKDKYGTCGHTRTWKYGNFRVTGNYALELASWYVTDKEGTILAEVSNKDEASKIARDLIYEEKCKPYYERKARSKAANLKLAGARRISCFDKTVYPMYDVAEHDIIDTKQRCPESMFTGALSLLIPDHPFSCQEYADLESDSRAGSYNHKPSRTRRQIRAKTVPCKVCYPNYGWR